MITWVTAGARVGGASGSSGRTSAPPSSASDWTVRTASYYFLIQLYYCYGSSFSPDDRRDQTFEKSENRLCTLPSRSAPPPPPPMGDPGSAALCQDGADVCWRSRQCYLCSICSMLPKHPGRARTLSSRVFYSWTGSAVARRRRRLSVTSTSSPLSEGDGGTETCSLLGGRSRSLPA